MGLDCARKTRLIQTAVKSAYFSPDRKNGALQKLNLAIILQYMRTCNFLGIRIFRNQISN